MLTAETRLTDFPSLEHRTYLNTAAEGIPPQAVIKALHQYAEDKILGMDGRIRSQRFMD
jgi:cysteine desulfurase/selenocysteine lyase